MALKGCVIDCNVLIKWFFEEKDSNEAEFFYKEAKDGKIKLYSPSIVELEFLGVLTRLGRSKNIENRYLENYFDYFIELCENKMINLVSLKNKRNEILKMSLERKIRYFDAEYLYLSKMLDIELITFDKDLKKKQSKI